jgi:hypothetical protein
MYKRLSNILPPRLTPYSQEIIGVHQHGNMSTRNNSWGGGGIKAAGALGWQLYHLQVPIVLKSGSLGSWNLQGLSRLQWDWFTPINPLIIWSSVVLAAFLLYQLQGLLTWNKLFSLLRILCSLLFCDIVPLCVTVFLLCIVLFIVVVFTASACDVSATTLTEVFPCFSLSCEANARV